jgi:hypothetical protein
MYFHNLQRFKSLPGYLRYNVLPIHRRYNLTKIALNRVPEVIFAARLKHVHAVAGVCRAAHDQLERFQAVGLGHRVPGVVVVNFLIVRRPALGWNYLAS